MKSKKETLTPKNDIIFKIIFGSRGNEAILKDFLEAILEIEIESVTLDLSTTLLPENYQGKKSEVDVRARLKDGTEVNIEMQAEKRGYDDKRCLKYWSKLYSQTIKKGEKYHKLRKTICIWIVDGEVFEEFQDYQSDWKIMDLKYHIKNHFNDLEFHIIELPKIRKNVTIKSSDKKFWLWFIDHTNKEMVEMACISNKQIQKARKQLDRIRSNRALMNIIDAQERYEMDQKLIMDNIRKEGREKGIAEGREKGIAEGREKGIAEGRKEGIAKGMAEGRAEGRAEGELEGIVKEKLEVAKRMLEEGCELELILKITGLSIEEINHLKE